MKKIASLVLFLVMVLAMQAQPPQAPHKFSPEQFDQELRQYITNEAGLTAAEAEKFFPVYQEMQQQQRALYKRQRQLEKQKPDDESGCKKAIQERDNIALEQRRVQQKYHNRFFDVLPASKVYDVLQAEERFHRQKLKHWENGRKRLEPKKNK